MVKENILNLSGIAPFRLEINSCLIDSLSPRNTFAAHTHADCEIYLNLSGDVSFMVENCVYPIRPGSVILSRPGEYHHCIYHSNALHHHYCLFFSCGGNERLLDLFFGREHGTGNRIQLDTAALAEATTLCDRLLAGGTPGEQYETFFSLLALLRAGGTPDESRALPDDVKAALSYLSRHLADPITVRDIADAAHTSVNTLERHFAGSLGITPNAYLRLRRLALAQKMLSGTASVQQISDACGFADCSRFITLFREQYGVTPLQYRRSGKK